MNDISTAPRDGTPILVYTGRCWELAIYDRGEWCGAHHSATHGNEIGESEIMAWVEQPEAPMVEK